MPVLLQIDAYDPATSAAVTLRAASHDEPALCHTDGQTWWPAIAKLPTLGYDLFDGDFGGWIQTASSSLVLTTEPWPAFAGYSFGDARLRLWVGTAGAPWSEWTLRFDGRVTAQPQIANGQATIAFAVDDRWLDAPLLATYAGTGGAEGLAALKGTVKPLALGAPRYLAGVLVNPTSTIVQLSAYGTIESVESAYDGLALFGSSAGDYVSYAALAAATIPAGGWATAKAVGMVRHGAPPYGQLSYMVRGDKVGPDGWARLPGDIIRRLALLSGGAGKIHDGSLDALDTARPYHLSVAVTEQTTARQVIQRIAASVNAVAGVSWLGQLFARPVGIGAPSTTLKADGSALPPVATVVQVEMAAPWWRLAIKADRTWEVHSQEAVQFTEPAEPGADVTIENTAKDTLFVAGRDSALLIAQVDSLNQGGPADNVPPNPPATPSLSTSTSIDVTTGQPVSRVTATWAASPEPDVAGYFVGIREGAGNFIESATTGTSYTWTVVAGRSYSVRIRAYDRNGNPSGYTVIQTITAAADGVAPGSVTNVVATPAFQSIALRWTSPAADDLDAIEIFEGTSSNVGTASLIATVKALSGGSNTYFRGGLDPGVTRYFFLRAVDTSGNRSGFVASGATTTEKVDAVDISGQLAAAQLASIEASKLIGTIVSTQIGDNEIKSPNIFAGAVTAGKIATGAVQAGNIDALAVNAGNIQSDAIRTNHIRAGEIVTNHITFNSLNGDRILADSLDANRVKANTVLAGTVYVAQANGDRTLEEIAQRAHNPAGRVNAAATLIEPGKISITNGGTLNDWRGGPDGTYINGARISAGSISTNQIAIGMRGVDIVDLQFSTNGNTISWTSGFFVYYDNDGTYKNIAVSAGSHTYPGNGGTSYIWWPKGGSSLVAGNDLSNPGVPFNNPNDVRLAIYRGGSNLNVNYGRTLIDGPNIKAGSITADRMSVFSLSAISANLGDITAGLLRDPLNKTRFDLSSGRLRFESGGYRFLMGSGSGIASNLLQWFGPTSVAEGNETVANSKWAMATDGKVYYGAAQLDTSGGGGGRTPISILLGNGHINNFSPVISVMMEAGQTITVSGAFSMGSNSSQGPMEMHFDWWGGSWNYFGSIGSDTVGPGEPGYVAGELQFTNQGQRQIYQFRAYVSGPNGAYANATTLCYFSA